MRVSFLMVWVLLALPSVAGAAESHLPEAGTVYGRLGDVFTGPYSVVLRPDALKPEWWAGAPSAVVGADNTVWLACRMRRSDLPRGLRGYELRLLKSADGEHFEEVKRIAREAVPIPGFERPALLVDPATGKFKLYACGPWKEGPWSIIKFDDADDPSEFNPTTARPVIVPLQKRFERDLPPVEYKDPIVTFAEGQYHAYVTGYVRQNERIFHFSSVDGETWGPVGDPYAPIMDLSGWHDFFVRPSSILKAGGGYLFVFEGSKTTWHDPVYNIATGLAFTFDLHTMIELTPSAPLAVSSTPNEHFATFRYSTWIRRGDEILIYAEVACPDETHEIRCYRIRD